MDIFIFGSRGPSGNFKFDSDVDVVVIEESSTGSDKFNALKSKFRKFALENSDVRAGLDLFYLKNLDIPKLESVYDLGNRTIEFESIESFSDFKKTWRKISEDELMKIVVTAKENCRYN